MKHELKIWPQYYARVADGSKTFEVRENDRGFQPGDEVVLKEWDPTTKFVMDYSPLGDREIEQIIGYTQSPALRFKVGYVLPIGSKRVVFSLLPLAELERTKGAE